jgi:hypothetical protein
LAPPGDVVIATEVQSARLWLVAATLSDGTPGVPPSVVAPPSSSPPLVLPLALELVWSLVAAFELVVPVPDVALDSLADAVALEFEMLLIAAPVEDDALSDVPVVSDELPHPAAPAAATRRRNADAASVGNPHVWD